MDPPSRTELLQGIAADLSTAAPRYEGATAALDRRVASLEPRGARLVVERAALRLGRARGTPQPAGPTGDRVAPGPGAAAVHEEGRPG